MNYRHVIFGILLLASAALLAPGCRKIDPVVPEVSESPETPEDPEVPLVFKAFADSTATKALNTAIPGNYDTRESFVTYAAFAETSFDASVPSSYTPFWDANGLTCSYLRAYNAWSPATLYYWPRIGTLTFQAYSPAGAEADMNGGTGLNFSWSNGFTFTNFVVPDEASPTAESSQYDLLYSERVENCRRSDYTITHNDGYDGYDDDPNYPTFIYNGINLTFHHALSQIEVQTSSSLGANASLKYYVQKIEIKNAYNKGTFTQNTADPATGDWAVNTSTKVDYTVLDKGSDWQLVPGADETPVSVNPAQTLMLLPQTLDRDPGSAPDYDTDAYLKVTYKEGASGEKIIKKIPLPDSWIRGNKYIYKLVFSNHIEFTATITKWDDEIVGYHRIII